MKNQKAVIIIILLLAFIPLGWWLVSHLPSKPKAPINSLIPDDSCQLVVNFYTAYLTDLDRETTVINSKEDLYNLYKSYLTPACANDVWRIVTTEHYEPILQAQDWSPNWRQYLQATPLPQSSGGRACRVVIDPNWNQTIVVKLVHEGDKYLISEFQKD